ncbi:MAG: hypothetical protein IJJ11_07440 [Methanosphaera sp.]|nr:hypothetical protein [Methanobrevibacter sp.]MBQ6444490.1 hypothetical protein [Methanosphaera sp.]
MIEINDPELLEELTQKLIEREFKDSIEAGEITEEDARTFIKKYIRFDIQPVVHVDDKIAAGINPSVTLDVVVNFNKEYYNHFIKNNGICCGNCVYYHMDEYCGFHDTYFPEYHSCSSWEKAE